MKEDMRRTAGPIVPARSKGIQIEIEEHCLRDIQGWCDAASSECSGYGLVKEVDGVFKIYKVFFPEQHCSSGYTLIKSEATARLDYSLFKHHQLSNPSLSPFEAMDSSPARFRRLWWHTHYDFNAFWSGTDDNQAQAMMESNGEWSISIVVNQKKDRLTRMDIMKPISVMVDEIQLKVVENTVKPPKRNYRRDILKWVHPLHVERKITVKPRSFTWGHSNFKSEFESKPQSDNSSKYVYFMDKLMNVDQYMSLLDCSCSENTCEECKMILETANA